MTTNPPTENAQMFGATEIARLKHNLDDTSYNEGSEALACRLSDCKTYIEQLEHQLAELRLIANITEKL